MKMLSDRDMLVRKLSILPLEVVCRNIAAGSLAQRLGITEGEVLPFPVVEFYLKDDALHDPLVNQDHIKIVTSVTEGDVKILKIRALEINALLKKFFEEMNVLLVDFKLEFGRDSANEIRLGDEISPDTCRFWDKTTHEKLDKDRFRRDMGGIEDAYQEMLRSVTSK
jgi:phosphoribosylaminoimidazole-succinocarboxamide synthase